MLAIQASAFGGPEVLSLAEVPSPVPGDGEVLVDVHAAGVNWADTHQAENSYLAPQSLPLVPGAEAVGTLADGSRVVALVTGGYAEQAIARSHAAFALPDEIGDGQALALVLQGLTAWHILRTSARMQAGESVVVHAAAGGVGTLAVQLARFWGAGRIIAVASSAEKRQLARDLGADATIDSDAEDLRGELLEANRGERVDVVLEMVGGRTFAESLSVLAPFGRLVTFGRASRQPIEPVQPVSLMGTSRGVIGFWLQHCIERPHMLKPAMEELLSLTASGALRAIVGRTYPLADARRAHEDIRARRTTGKLVLEVGPRPLRPSR